MSNDLHLYAKKINSIGGFKKINISNGVLKYKEPESAVFYLLDTSGSMERQFPDKKIFIKITVAKEIISKIINNYSENHLLGLISFGNDAKVICELSSSKYILLQSLGMLKTDGVTSMNTALNLSYDRLMDRDIPVRSILITDGMQTDSSDEELISTARKFRENNIIIDCIFINDFDTKNNVMKELCRITNGVFFEVSTCNDFLNKMIEISPKLRIDFRGDKKCLSQHKK